MLPSRGCNATGESDTRPGTRHCAKPAFADVQFTAKERKKRTNDKKKRTGQTGFEPATLWVNRLQPRIQFRSFAQTVEFDSGLCSDWSVIFLRFFEIFVFVGGQSTRNKKKRGLTVVQYSPQGCATFSGRIQVQSQLRRAPSYRHLSWI